MRNSPRGLRVLLGRLFLLVGHLGLPLPGWARPLALEAAYQPLLAGIFRENCLWARLRLAAAIPAGDAESP